MPLKSEKNNVTRREMLFPKPAQDILRNLRDSIWHNGGPRNNVIEKLGEFSSILSILMIAWIGKNEPNIQYEISSYEQLVKVRSFEKMQEEIAQLDRIFNAISVELAALQTLWENSYRKLETDMQPTFDSEGNLSFELVTNVRWYEPESLKQIGFDRNFLDRIKYALNINEKKVSKATQQAEGSFVLDNGVEDLRYKAQATKDNPFSKINMSIYGSIGILYKYYEELYQLFDTYNRKFIDANQYIKRRTVTKFAAASLLAGFFKGKRENVTSENKLLLKKLQVYNGGILRMMPISDTESFERYFELNVEDMYTFLLELYQKLSLAEKQHTHNDFDVSVLTQIQRVKLRTVESYHSLIKLFNIVTNLNNEIQKYQISLTMVQFSQYAWATEQIQNNAQKEMNTLGSHKIKDLLITISALSLTALASEAAFPLLAPNDPD